MAQIKTHECRIARRGKGAKGTIVVHTFGEPILETGKSVCKAWDYSKVAKKYQTEDILKALKKLGDLNEILLTAGDLWNKSANMRAIQKSMTIAQRLIAEKLVTDEHEAKRLAGEMLSMVSRTMELNAIDAKYSVITIDEQIDLRKKQVKKLTEQGLFKPMEIKVEKVDPKAPRLVKVTEESEIETDEESDDSDSDETDE